MKRRPLVVIGAALAAFAVPATVSASLVWTLGMIPLTATANISTAFTLTATNLDPLNELGCLEVDLPASFVIESLGAPTTRTGIQWVSTQTGSAVVVHSLSGGGRLELGDWVRFTIRAHATTPGVFLWPNHNHLRQDCGGSTNTGVPVSVTVLPALIPTPTPTPVPTATPAPTPAPTPILPLPSLPLPSIPLPSVGLLPTPRPTPGPGDSPAPGSTGTPEPSRSADANGGSGGIGTEPPAGGSSGGSAGGAFTVARGLDDGGADVQVGVDAFGLLDGDFVWTVPAASVAIPGLLVIIWVVLQTIGALAWIPAVRRVSEESADRRKPMA